MLHLHLEVGQVVQIVFPQDKPLFGWRGELQLRVGLCTTIQEVDQTTFRVFLSSLYDVRRIKDGLEEFTVRHPGVEVNVFDDI